ncbi:MAG: hypothetical protein KatS3mg101_0340 [Patescibacteria group bacterium]|nr:MAG: hypothetical protein KatS3mg101_0340 [Patescibacteria group bacterium]
MFSVFYGFERMQKEALEMSDKVLVQTELEAKDLEKTFGVKFDYEIVRNGVSPHFMEAADSGRNPLGISNYIICVGRIEPRKKPA